MGVLNLPKEKKYQLIDKLLDSYNHYMKLYAICGKLEYKDRADVFMNTLKYYFSTNK
ncbi:MAG TPA: hypothetical protein VJ824_11350 [Bacillota bacterium]|nr:hypothetical protein [Bacillota bacterium]